MSLRRLAVLVPLAACAMIAHQARARVQAEHKESVPDATHPETVREIYRAKFDNADLNLEYTVRDGEPIREKWGDGFFGLRLGYVPRNGGWSRWDFLDVLAKTPAGTFHLLQRRKPTVFAAYAVAGSDRLVAEWRDGAGCLRLRMVAHPAFRNWIFCDLSWKALAVERVVLSAYPGNAAAQIGRERHFAVRGKDWNLARESASFVPQSGAALLYSRYFDEAFGNQLVFDAPSVSHVDVAKATTRVDVALRPKGRRLAFALGGFADSDPDGQLVRFLGEDADAVADFLVQLDFDASPDSAEFRRSLSIALGMGVEREVLRAIAARYRTAAATHDVAGLVRCLDEVGSLRLEKARSELMKLR